ncbi:MAG: cytochrome b, partial [Paracoccaceae bacterium]
AEEPYSSISLIATTYWFAYFLVVLPLLGVLEKPLQQPDTIEEDFNAHYGKASGGAEATPAE